MARDADKVSTEILNAKASTVLFRQRRPVHASPMSKIVHHGSSILSMHGGKISVGSHSVHSVHSVQGMGWIVRMSVPSTVLRS